jgi:methylglutamate dehydrogenase subunit D
MHKENVCMFEWHSALAGGAGAGGRDGVRGGRQLRLTEVRGWHLAQLAVFAQQRSEFQERLRALSGAQLPEELYRGITHNDSRLVRITPTQYWWFAAGNASMVRLARELPPSAGTVTMLSEGRVRVRIAGPNARDVLAKGIPLDLHPKAFQVGQSAQTGLHHTGVFLERVADDGYEIYVPRSYAAWLWEWLIDAALPFGYDIMVEEPAPTNNNSESHQP